MSIPYVDDLPLLTKEEITAAVDQLLEVSESEHADFNPAVVNGRRAVAVCHAGHVVALLFVPEQGVMQ